MLIVELPPEALARVRLTYSPMWELTTSLRLLVHEPESTRHREWVRWARPRVPAGAFGLLGDLMTAPYAYPDFLTPTPGSRPRPFARELADVRRLDPCRLRAEVEATVADTVPRSVARVLAAADPLADVAGALDEYWQAVLAPVWGRLRRVLSADVAYRADELASEGLHVMLNRLHPSVAFNGRELRIPMRACEGRRAAETVHELALVACAFGWPELLVVATEGQPVALSYGPRGAGALWHQRSARAGQPLVALVGRSRAAILSLLDLPVSSSQIAEQTGLSLPGVSQHLAVLRGAGLVDTRRSGRTAWSVRTDLGTRLLSPTAQPETVEDQER